MHLINSIILTLSWIPEITFTEESVLGNKIRFIVILFWLYLQLFLIYLVIQFTRKMQQSKFKDQVLSKEVPFTVFIQNQRIYSIACLTKTYDKGELKMVVKDKLAIVQQRFDNQMNIGILSNDVSGVLEQYVELARMSSVS